MPTPPSRRPPPQAEPMAQPGADLKTGPVVDLNDPAVAGSGNWLTQKDRAKGKTPAPDASAQ